MYKHIIRKIKYTIPLCTDPGKACVAGDLVRRTTEVILVSVTVKSISLIAEEET